MIEVRELAKSFGRVRALGGVSFEAPRGLITGLLGPNGAGKSTCLRILSTVMRADTGSASVGGHDVRQEPLAVLKRSGVLPHGAGLYPHLTAVENIAYYGRLHGMDGNGLQERIDYLIDLLDMEEIADRPTEGFSTGQKVKVAIARALVHDPPNMMLDEPTVGLDVMSTRTMRQVIRQLSAEGRTVLFSSHIMQEVASLCDNIVIIANGRVVAQGTADELRQQTGEPDLEDAFVSIIGSGEGLQ